MYIRKLLIIVLLFSFVFITSYELQLNSKSQNQNNSGQYISILTELDPITLEDVIDELEERWGSQTRIAYDYTVRNYRELANSFLYNVSTIQTMIGTVKVLYFSTFQGNIMLALQIQCSGDISQLLYTRRQNQFDDLAIIAQNLIERNSLQRFRLLKIQASQTTYFYDFLSFGTIVQRIIVQRQSIFIQGQLNFRIQSTNLAVVTFSRLQKKLVQRNSRYVGVAYQNFIYYENGEFIVYDYGDASISLELDYCQFITNEIVQGRNSYNFDPNFFSYFKRVKQISPIANLPPIKNVSVIQTIQGPQYQLTFFISNTVTQEQIDFNLQFVVPPQTDNPIITSIQIGGQTIISEIIQTSELLDQLDDDDDTQILFDYTHVIIGCLEYSGDICILCRSDFHLSDDGTCFVKDVNCISNIGIVCSECVQGYYLEANRCYRIPENCLIPSQKGNVCLLCQDGYSLNSQQQCKVNNCQRFAADTLTCQECAFRYYLIRNLNRCQNVSEFCLQYDPYSPICFKCIEGYELRNPFQCIPFILIQNCIEYDLGNCVRCRQNFYLDPFINQCNLLPQFCLQYDIFSSRCVRCELGYTPSINGICVPSRKRCIQYADSGICLQCQNAYETTINGYCSNFIKFCKIYLDNQQCAQCVDNYTLTLGRKRCVSQIIFCQVYYENGNCSKCQTNYVLTYDGRCVHPIPNCLKIGVWQCLQCYEGYHLILGSCIPDVRFCNNYDKTGCTDCIYPYKLNNKTCIIPHCLSYNWVTYHCQRCLDKYVLVSSDNNLAQCVPQVQFCEIYKPQTSICQNCIADYSLDGNKCIKMSKIEGCIKYEGQLCIQCIPTKIVSNNTCVTLRIIENCQYQTQQRCQICSTNYTLTQIGQCQPFINVENCMRYQESGVCLQCESGFFLSEGRNFCLGFF